jgi:hypothetical protein
LSIYGDAVEEAGSILWQSYLFFFVAALGRTGIAMPPTAILGSNTMVPSAVLERFGAAVSVALEVSSASRVSLALALAGMMLEGPVAARAALIDAAGAVVAAGDALIVLAGAPAPPIVAGVSPLGRVVIIANL